MFLLEHVKECGMFLTAWFSFSITVLTTFSFSAAVVAAAIAALSLFVVKF